MQIKRDGNAGSRLAIAAVGSVLLGLVSVVRADVRGGVEIIDDFFLMGIKSFNRIECVVSGQSFEANIFIGNRKVGRQGCTQRVIVAVIQKRCFRS